MWRARFSRDLTAVLALTILGVVVAFLSVPDWVRAVLDLPLVFFLPGYALSRALLRPGTLGAAERFAYSLAGSVAIAILAGVVVQLVFALDRAAWAIVLGAIAIAATLAAAARRDSDPEPWAGLALPSLGSVLGIGAAAAAASFAIVVATTAAGDAQTRSHFTALSILPVGASRDGHQAVSVAVENHTGELAGYELSVTQAGRGLLREDPAVGDGSKATWRVDASTPSSAAPVTATLRMGGRVYRRVYLRSVPPR